MKFNDDYLLSWDFSNTDLPIVNIMLLHSDQKGVHILCEHLASSNEKAGVVSLNQLLAKYFSQRTFEELEKLRKDIAEHKIVTKKGEENGNS